MSNKIDSHLAGLLNEYDELMLKNFNMRIVYKPLYDYFMILVKEVGIKYIGLDNNIFGPQLNGRWNNIEIFLKEIDSDTKTWNGYLNNLHKLRNLVEHNDCYIPSKKNLQQIRGVVPEFTKWITATGVKYYQESKNFTFIKSFYHINQNHMKNAEMLIHEYGEEPPYFDNPYKIETDSGGYSQLVPLIYQIKERSNKIYSQKDIKRTDIDCLLKLVQITSFLKGREDIILMNNLCPKCGDKLKEINHYFGGNESDPQPVGVHWKYGCSNCDYYVEQDTEYF